MLVMVVVSVDGGGECERWWSRTLESWTELTAVREELWQCRSTAVPLQRPVFWAEQQEPQHTQQESQYTQQEPQHTQQESQQTQQESQQTQKESQLTQKEVLQIQQKLQQTQHERQEAEEQDLQQGWPKQQQGSFEEQKVTTQRLYGDRRHYNQHDQLYIQQQEHYNQQQLRSQPELMALMRVVQGLSAAESTKLLSYLAMDGGSFTKPTFGKHTPETLAPPTFWEELFGRASGDAVRETSYDEAKLEALIRDTNEYIKVTPNSLVNKVFSSLKRPITSLNDEILGQKLSYVDSNAPVDTYVSSQIFNVPSVADVASRATSGMNLDIFSNLVDVSQDSQDQLGQIDERKRRKSSEPAIVSSDGHKKNPWDQIAGSQNHARLRHDTPQRQFPHNSRSSAASGPHNSRSSAASGPHNSRSSAASHPNSRVGGHIVQKRDTSAQFLIGRGVQSTATTVRVPSAQIPSASFSSSSAASESSPNEASSSSDHKKQSSSNKFYRSLLNKRLNDPFFNSSASWSPSLDEEYVLLLERQVRDLRARVKSCRSCLTRRERRTPSCGGGAGWRAHRRQEKMMRRRLKQQRKLGGEEGSPGGGDWGGIPPGALRSGCRGHEAADATEETTVGPEGIATPAAGGVNSPPAAGGVNSPPAGRTASAPNM
ncbi:hypothetical protein FHG87_022010 [Trinorchestia longiramus]|nr:hypothetical protein FHG87_022010 [Trinorchestia longiramus]